MHGMLRMPCPHRTVSHLLRKQTLNNLSQPPISVRALNTEGVAASLTEQNQLSRDAQKAERQKLGLSHTDSLANIVNASWKIKEMDLEYRKSMDPKDTSTDVLGIVQYSTFHDGLTAGLFTKQSIILLSEMIPTERCVLYYDATGGILGTSRNVFGTVKHLLNTFLSFAPAEFFLNEEDSKHSDKLFSAHVLAELISHNQGKAVHVNFVRRLMTACSERDENCKAPLLVNTDHDGAMQNGWLDGCRTDPNQVANRIMWANVMFPVLLWFEYLTETNATYLVKGYVTNKVLHLCTHISLTC